MPPDPQHSPQPVPGARQAGTPSPDTVRPLSPIRDIQDVDEPREVDLCRHFIANEIPVLVKANPQPAAPGNRVSEQRCNRAVKRRRILLKKYIGVNAEDVSERQELEVRRRMVFREEACEHREFVRSHRTRNQVLA